MVTNVDRIIELAEPLSMKPNSRAEFEPGTVEILDVV